MKQLLLKSEKTNLLFSNFGNKLINSKLINFVKTNMLKSLFVVFTYIISLDAHSQAASATWALTSNASVATTGSITANTAAIGASLVSPTHSANGISTSSWSNDASSLVTDEYYEYRVNPTAGNLLTMNSVTLNHSTNNGSWIGAVYYSLDGFATTGTQLGSNFTSTTSLVAFSVTGQSILVLPTQNFTIRVYGWESDGNNRFRNRNVVISGTTCAMPSITGNTPASRCETGTLTLDATASSGTINWYTALTGGTSLATGTSFTTPSIAATTTYYVDATNGCGTSTPRTLVTATVTSTPTITGNTPASRCGTGTVTLGATASAGTINWYTALTGGTSLATGTSFTTPSIAVTTTYYVDATNTGCTSSPRTAITATINTIPTITGNTPASRCGTGTVTLGANASAGTINWYAALTGGTSLGTGTSFTTPSIASTTTYYVDATNGCTTAPRIAVIATINTIPTITGTTPGSRTGTGTVNLGAIASAGTINWYATASGGASLGTGTAFTTPVISTTTTFYVDATNNGCTTGVRTPVVATVNYTEIDILGNATSIISGDITPTITDWTDFGTTNTTRTFTIRNMGVALLTVGDITFSGANASEFTVTTAPSSTIAISSSTTFIVTFAPTAIGLRTATISIVNNDNDENPYIFDIQGTGVEQEINIQGNGISIVDSDTTPTTADWTDFSNVAGTRTFTIRNTGNIALTIGTISISGTNASDFTVTTPPAASVAANSSTTFVITFSPSAINTRTATVTIDNDDNTENPYDFAIQGFGIIPEIDIQGNAVSIPDSTVLSPTLANWTDFGSTTATRTFTIFNNGNISLNIGAIAITGVNASEFTVTTPPSASIAAFSSATFVVTFIPTALGVRTASINIVNDDTNENPYNFNIQGTGTPLEIDLQGNGISIPNNAPTASVSTGSDFGPADINLATVTHTFTILNTGALSLTISNPTISGVNASEFTITANPGTLTIGAGSSTTFQVTFNPSGVFVRDAQINIINDDSDENPYRFKIQGTGLLDNDGDGIENNVDQDDDNDGIIDIIECGICISDPFVNGGFETPVIGAATYAILPTPSVNGWQTSAEDFIEIWSAGFNGFSGPAVPAAAGNQFAELNANVAGILYQTFCLNGAGGSINWAIKHRGRYSASAPLGTDTAFVKFGDNLANAITSTPIVTMVDGNTAWGSYSGTYTIPAGQTNIVLTFQAGSTASGSPSVGNFIDDIQIIINQNCIDSDSDGIADLLDVDDENDGISDIEEAGFKAYSNGKSTMDRTNVATWVDANVNGLNDYIDTLISGGTYSIPDTDGDNIPNHLDLDSDNDTLFDVDESGLLNGDGDITGDGKGDGLDTEGDGLLNLYDNSALFGTTTRIYAQDSDSNGISDYLQLDSNDDGIDDIQTGLYGSFDTNGDGKIDGTGDSDRDGILNSFDTNDVAKGSPRDLNRKLFLDFDGRNDYAQDATTLGALANATLMAWIDLNPAFSLTGVVVGNPNFLLRITSGRRLEAVVNGTVVSSLSTTRLNKSQWYHVAAVYDGTTVIIYLNGVEANSAAATGIIPSDVLTLGKNAISSTEYFKGKIDEVRVFNVALTGLQVQRMVYQEIQNTASQVRGAIVPKDIESLPFVNVLRYFRMDAYKDDIIDNLTTVSIDTGTGMKIFNHKVINVQQAPMPFTTIRTGTFATAVNDVTKDIRGLDVVDFDYSIIQVKHNITETANNTDLAMFVDPAITVNMTNNTKIQNDWYLKLDGKIDLVGKSQLVQTINSELDVTSAGSIERDQEGDSNKFNYNYWSSPLSSINNTTINHGFTVAGVMKDGTTTTPENITWTSGINGAATSPITLSSYWIFKFQNLSNAYANWASVGQNGTLLAGQGFTMKGSAAATANQNYTFVGKPNNGTITSTVSANNLNLCGNPYASAIDADQFIDDNAASIKGTLFFWEHYNTNTSHNTVEYQGGYATYTKVGGTAPVAPSGISGAGSSSKTPKRFIPVGQGFFVTGSAIGGTITFNNSQRLFVKEDDGSSYTLFRSNTNQTTDSAFYNSNDTYTTEDFMKLRLGYISASNYHRQILLGFMDQNATAGYDEGYDGLSIETLTNDMYFINGTNKLNIQGDSYFNVNNIYPLGIKNATAGNVKFAIDNKENFNDDQEIYIYDSLNSQYHSIKSQDFEINLPAGVIENRFSLRFTTSTSLGTNDNELENEIGITHSQSDNIITIKNELLSVEIKSVMLFNLLGQSVMTWKIDNSTQTKIELPVTNISTGAYIVKVITDKGDTSKKIMVK